ncbi:MAG: DUF6434 domain-containing protein [Pseudomonadota bacterium]
MRPDPDSTMTAEAFDRWYWPVAELRQFCDALALSSAGTKAQMRARVLAVLHGEAPPPLPRRARGTVNRARATLTPETVIDEGVSFGPNVRTYFKGRIGKGFRCHGDFMDWMRGAAGQTLADAEAAWYALEARGDDPAFRREIAECNNMLRYLRALRDAHPEVDMARAQACWAWKSRQPAAGGFVVFEDSDLTRA